MRRSTVLGLAAVAAGVLLGGAARAADLYLAIEVGGSAVKAVVLDPAQPTKPVAAKERQTSLAASVGESRKSYDPAAVKETADAAAALYDELKQGRDGIKLVVAVSSGVVGAIGGDRNSDGVRALVDALKGLPVARPVEPITAAEEVRLTLLQAAARTGTAPADVFLVDVGSANIKFGCVDGPPKDGRHAGVYGEVVQGTKKLAADLAASAEVASKSGDEQRTAFLAAAEREAKGTVAKAIRDQVEKMPLAGKKKVFLTGGAAFLLVAAVKKEALSQPTAELTPADVDAYFKLSAGEPVVPDVAKRIFTPQQAAVAARLVGAVFAGLNRADGTLTFVNNAQTFWISQFVAESAAPTPPPDKPNGPLPSATDPEVAKLLQEILKKMPRDPVEKKDIQDIADAIRKLSERPGAGTPPPGTQPIALPSRPAAPGTPFDPDAGWKLFYRGRELYDAGKHADAATFFTSALRSADYEVPFWFGLAMAESAAGKTAAAKAAAGRVAELLYARADLAADAAQHFERQQGAVRQTVEGYVRDATDRLRLAGVR